MAAAKQLRIDNDHMSNPNRGCAGLERARLELHIIQSQLRFVAFLSDVLNQLPRPVLCASAPRQLAAGRRAIVRSSQIGVPACSRGMRRGVTDPSSQVHSDSELMKVSTTSIVWRWCSPHSA
jgi:hypothetical protein